jgi:hypothetical protein
MITDASDTTISDMSASIDVSTCGNANTDTTDMLSGLLQRSGLSSSLSSSFITSTPPRSSSIPRIPPPPLPRARPLSVSFPLDGPSLSESLANIGVEQSARPRTSTLLNDHIREEPESNGDTAP